MANHLYSVASPYALIKKVFLVVLNVDFHDYSKINICLRDGTIYLRTGRNQFYSRIPEAGKEGG